jgi:1-deoxy-D-xylulose-5-phosphate reductoisomerase
MVAKRILIFGSTGSIGVQALDVCARSEELQVVGLSAGSAWEPLVRRASRLQTQQPPGRRP